MKNQAAVELGRSGGLVGGRSKSDAKLAASRANIAKATEARIIGDALRSADKVLSLLFGRVQDAHLSTQVVIALEKVRKALNRKELTT